MESRNCALLVITLLTSPNVPRIARKAETHDVNAIPRSVAHRGAVYLFIEPERDGLGVTDIAQSPANGSKFEGFRENCECALGGKSLPFMRPGRDTRG